MAAGELFEPVPIETDRIKLDAFLKWAGIVMTGGQAKRLIEEGEILVNGREERRRGRKLSVGDIVELRDSGLYQVTREN